MNSVAHTGDKQSQSILSERLNTVLSNGTTCAMVGLNLAMFPEEIEQVAAHLLT